MARIEIRLATENYNNVRSGFARTNDATNNNQTDLRGDEAGKLDELVRKLVDDIVNLMVTSEFANRVVTDTKKAKELATDPEAFVGVTITVSTFDKEVGK